MTKEQRNAVDQAALQAAHSAVDAHGADAPGPKTAWEFMEENAWAEDGRPENLPEAMPAEFVHDYRRHCQNILAGNPFYERASVEA